MGELTRKEGMGRQIWTRGGDNLEHCWCTKATSSATICYRLPLLPFATQVLNICDQLRLLLLLVITEVITDRHNEGRNSGSSQRRRFGAYIHAHILTLIVLLALDFGAYTLLLSRPRNRPQRSNRQRRQRRQRIYSSLYRVLPPLCSPGASPALTRPLLVNLLPPIALISPLYNVRHFPSAHCTPFHIHHSFCCRCRCS